MTKAGMFFDEFIASMILMFVIFALKDDTNKGSFSASGAWFPLGTKLMGNTLVRQDIR